MTDWSDDRAHEWLGDNIGDYCESAYWRDRCDGLSAELRAAYERGVLRCVEIAESYGAAQSAQEMLAMLTPKATDE